MRSFSSILLFLAVVSVDSTASTITFVGATGPDQISVLGFEGREGISELYRFELELASARNQGLAFDSFLGRELSATLTLPDGSVRHFSGICSRVTEEIRDRQFVYRVELRPRLWELTRQSRTRFFQDMRVPEVLQQVLGEHALNTEFKLTSSFPARDYCVQYRESDFDFVSRLMEEEGIFYFFRHDAEGHTMVISDTPGGHPELVPAVQLVSKGAGITSWAKSQEIRSGKVTLRDFLFHFPDQSFEVSETIQPSVNAGQITHSLLPGNASRYEIYDYPGEYAHRFDNSERPSPGQVFSEGQRASRVRMQQEAVNALTIQGNASEVSLVSGAIFTFAGHPNASGKYLITGVQHSYTRGGSKGEIASKFTCIPEALPYRPQRTTPRPVAAGPQSAIVLGGTGGTHTDTFGRIKVKFHWDRSGDSSVWIRVAVTHSGSGTFSLPEVGDEVLVAFEHGDPSRPVVLGALWDGSDDPPTEQ